MPTLWRIDPGTLPAPSANKRALGRKPLIDLTGLQRAITDRCLEADDVWLATTRAERKLEDLTWRIQDLLDCIGQLTVNDYKNSQWCEDRTGHWHACDAYAIAYDDHAKRRVRHSDICYYLKFSLTEGGALTLVLISCHL